MSESPKLQLNDGEWAVYMRAHDGPWELVGTEKAPDDPGSAARIVCAEKWTGGTHAVLVAGPQGAAEYRITLETEEVKSSE